jgi:1,4-alpha-glucan branching enzyme
VISVSVLQPATPVRPAPARVLVQFRLGDPGAHEVALVGDFNGWHPEHRLHEVESGVWSVDVALAPGIYNYVFVIDGKTWRLDPLAPRVTDGFGGASSRVAVLAPEARS